MLHTEQPIIQTELSEGYKTLFCNFTIYKKTNLVYILLKVRDQSEFTTRGMEFSAREAGKKQIHTLNLSIKFAYPPLKSATGFSYPPKESDQK